MARTRRVLVEKHITIGVSFALIANAHSRNNTPANVAPPMPLNTAHSGAPRRHHRPARHTHPTTCKRILAPFLMRVRFGSSCICGSSRIPQLSPLMARLFASTAAVQAQPQPTQQNLGERRILVPIPTVASTVAAGFDHTWLLAQALRQVLGEKPGSGRGCVTRSCGGRSTGPIEPIAGSTMPVVSSLRQALRPTHYGGR